MRCSLKALSMPHVTLSKIRLQLPKCKQVKNPMFVSTKHVHRTFYSAPFVTGKVMPFPETFQLHEGTPTA